MTEVKLPGKGPENVGGMIEIVIPESVKILAKEGVARFVAKMGEFKPDLMLVLPRSGSLAFNVIEGYAEASGMSLPPTKEVLIGRETSSLFEEETDMDLVDLAHHVKSETELPLVIPDHAATESYYRWLENEAGKPKSAVSVVVGEVQEIIATNGATRVLVVDDCVAQGVTGYLTAPKIIKMANPDVVIGIVPVLNDGGWVDEIAKTNIKFPDGRGWQQAEIDRQFAKDLVKGGVDSEGELVRFTSDNILEMGQRLIDERSGWYGDTVIENPAQALIRKYGMEIATVSEKVAESLKNLGKEIH